MCCCRESEYSPRPVIKSLIFKIMIKCFELGACSYVRHGTKRVMASCFVLMMRCGRVVADFWSLSRKYHLFDPLVMETWSKWREHQRVYFSHKRLRALGYWHWFGGSRALEQWSLWFCRPFPRGLKAIAVAAALTYAFKAGKRKKWGRTVGCTFQLFSPF